MPKRILDLWNSLSPETRETILTRWPWLIAFVLGMLAASYLGWCACTPKAEGAEPRRKVCLCSPLCACGCNEGQECQCEGSRPAKAEPKQNKGDWRTSGVVKDDGTPAKLDGKRITLHGAGGQKHLSAEQARILLSESKLPDDSNKVHVTIIGAKERRKQVRDDLAKVPELVALADRILVQDYSPEDWPVKDVGYQTTGDPTIVIQSRRGGVLHAQYEYRGAAPLAQAIEKACAEAVRRADPERDPSKDPDLNRPSMGGSAILDYASRVPTPAWLIGGAGLAILFLGGRKSNVS